MQIVWNGPEVYNHQLCDTQLINEIKFICYTKKHQLTLKRICQHDTKEVKICTNRCSKIQLIEATI